MKKTEQIPDSYAKSGVDFKKEELAVRHLVTWARKTLPFRKGKIGAALEDIARLPILWIWENMP